MKSDRHNGHGSRHHDHPSETPDVSHIMNVDVTHEMSDVSTEGVLKFIIGLSIMTALTLALMWFLFNMLNSKSVMKDAEAPPGPMAMTEEERLPPEPRLQEAKGFGVKLESGQWVPLDAEHSAADPQAEYRVLRQQWDETLKNGKRDQAGNVVAVPIEEAMKKVLEGNALPTRPAENMGADAISIPTAASSGRISVRKQ